METTEDDDRSYNDDSFDMFGAGDYGPDAGTGDFVPLLKFEDKDYEQNQDDDRVGVFEDVTIDPKVDLMSQVMSYDYPTENDSNAFQFTGDFTTGLGWWSDIWVGFRCSVILPSCQANSARFRQPRQS